MRWLASLCVVALACGPDANSAGGDETTASDGPRICQPSCSADIDCCEGDPDCEAALGTTLNFACADGLCVNRGCNADDQCAGGYEGMEIRCISDGEYGVCGFACESDDDCPPSQLTPACTGEWAGVRYCAMAACTTNADCLLDSLECDTSTHACVYVQCHADAECGEQKTCDPTSHLCVCADDGDCADGKVCAPT